MYASPIRLLADWLKDPTTGVNAMLEALPKEEGDTIPSVEAIKDETRDPDAANGHMPSNVKTALVVESLHLENITGTPSQDIRDFDLVVAIRVGVANLKPHQATTYASYVLHAVVRSLQALQAEARESDRARNGIVLYEQKSLQAVPAFEGLKNSTATGAVVVTYAARDITSLS